MLATMYVDCGCVILGDFNRVDVDPLLRAHCLKQVVDKPTRGDAVLDLFITNVHSHYMTPEIMSPMGLSDHNTVLWIPQNGMKRVNRVIRKTSRPVTYQNNYEFGQWITSKTWDEVLAAPDTQLKSDSFYSSFQEAVDKYFPRKSAKLRIPDKAWMTAGVKATIKHCQEAFASGPMTQW